MAKSPKVNDPFASREAKKYDHPIPSREYILEHLQKAGTPMDYPSLCSALGMTTDDQQEALRRRLIAMSRDGQLISNRRGVYGLADRMELVRGRVQGTKDEYGFFIPADGSGDMYLSATEMRKVFDGDTVLARFTGFDNRGRREGMVVEILQRRSDQVVGRYYSDSGIGILVPANRRISHEILVPENQNHGAVDGQFVVGEITTFPSPRHKPVARIVEILGDSATPGLEIDIAIRSHDLPYQWPKAVKKQLASMDLAITAEDIRQRRDLRQLPFVTIDGEDAKDFDDAVLAVPSAGGGWTLYVAIADVSHYVGVGSALDEEATNRGNSVYFPGHVIPMLPEELSNGVCSLKPKEDRLVMVCQMDVHATGTVKDFSFYEAVIHSHARLTYTEVADILEPAETESGQKLQQRLVKRHESLVDNLTDLYALYASLRQVREIDGAMDFESTETRIVFGENRRIAEIVPVVRNCAHRIIEECMLRANVAAGELLLQAKLPVLFRVHDRPGEDKLSNLREYLREMGLSLGGGDTPSPEHYQHLLRQISLRPNAHLLQTMVIRSMMQAVYQPQNIGHFGLGFPVYTHFTSPIRRYPDLLVHRAIRSLTRSGKKQRHILSVSAAPVLPKARIYPYTPADMQRLGENCSVAERRADAAGYDVVDWLKCEYMQNRLGDEFDGIITSVTGFGLFVELDGIYIEGLVHITALDNDYYHFDPVRHELTGERKGKHYQMGDTVRVRVAAVNLDERKIDLVMTDATPRPGGERGRNRRDKQTSGKSGKPNKQKNRQQESGRKDNRKGAGDSKGNKGNKKSNKRKGRNKSGNDQQAAGKQGNPKSATTGRGESESAGSGSLRQAVAAGTEQARSAGKSAKPGRTGQKSGRRGSAGKAAKSGKSGKAGKR